MSFSRSAYAKSCDGFVPQETDFKRLALVLSSASACKKLAMVSSLKTMFQKRPMAPTFLSSSTTRRHNNARPPPAHTLLSAAAERSSSGFHMSSISRMPGHKKQINVEYFQDAKTLKQTDFQYFHDTRNMDISIFPIFP